MIRDEVGAVGDDVSDHKFKVGQMVHYTPGPFGSARPGDVKVIQHLPPGRAVNADIASSVLTSHLIGLSRKTNSNV